VADLLRARKDLLPLALANNAKLDAVDAYAEVVEASSTVRMEMENGSGWEGFEEPAASKKNHTTDPRELIIDIREYDVAYYLRVAIDNGQHVSVS
jgi:DNA polymerase epsilon subunit 1